MMYRTIKKLYFEPSSRCNLNCAMCLRNSWIGETHGDLEMRLFYKALKDEEALRDTHTIFFGGMGEPLVHMSLIHISVYSHDTPSGNERTDHYPQQLFQGLHHDRLAVRTDYRASAGDSRD